MKMVAKIGGRKAGEGNGKKKYGCGCEVEKGRWKKKILPLREWPSKGEHFARSRFFHHHVYEVNFIVHTILDMLGLKQ